MDSLIPYGQLRWIVDRFSVGMTPDEVKEAVLSRMIGPEWTDKRKDKAIQFALECHKDNQSLYKLINGSF